MTAPEAWLICPLGQRGYKQISGEVGSGPVAFGLRPKDNWFIVVCSWAHIPESGVSYE